MRTSGLLALPMAILLGGPALAADLPPRAPAPVYTPPPPPPPVISWSGFYAGGSVGARWSNTDGEVTSVLAGDPSAAPPNLTIGPKNAFNSVAFRGGGYVGANLQVSPMFVVGIEGDGAWANNKQTRDFSFFPSDIAFNTTTVHTPGPAGFPLGGQATDTFQVRTTWDASLRGRAGVLVTPTVLVYATGGVAWLQLEGTGTCSIAPALGVDSNCAPGNYFTGTLSPAVIVDKTTRTGWTLGGGGEGMFTPHLLWRAEYRYSDFGTAKFTDTRTCTGACIPAETTPLVVSYTLRTVTHTAYLGLAYKF